MAGALRVSARLTIPENELSWRFSRSSGPGGQSVNTADSRVELSFDVVGSPSLPDYLKERAVEHLSTRLVHGVLTVVAGEHRSQMQNRQAAERKLANVLAQAIAPPPPARRPTKPTRSAKKARVDDKRHRGEIKRMRRSSGD